MLLLVGVQFDILDVVKFQYHDFICYSDKADLAARY